MRNFGIDGHKIQYHPERIAQWLKAKENWDLAKKVYPLYVEISPVGHCNHRCTFCAIDYLGYKRREIEKETLSDRIKEMGLLGVKSVMFAGEGEPLLSSHIPELLEVCSQSKIDSSFTTNFSRVSEDQMNTIVQYSSWIKVSFNGCTPEEYSQIHKTSPQQFDKTLENIKRCVELRNKMGSKLKIGVQTVLLPENQENIEAFVQKLKSIGVDYYTIKPYSRHAYSSHESYTEIKYKNIERIQSLKKYTTESFQFVFRDNAFDTQAKGEFKYKKCSSTPFMWAYLMSTGDIYACSAYLEDSRFLLGNINQSSFQGIWEGDLRKKCFEYVTQELDISNCRLNCRMNNVNQYLENIATPPEHVNFI